MMEKELPKGWIELKIEELTSVVAGGTPSTSMSDYFDGEVAWITPADLSGYKKKYISHGRKNISAKGLANSSARLLPKGSILFSSRAPIGYVAIAANELATNQGFKNLLPNGAFDSSFAYYYLKHVKDYAESQASGTTFKELSGSKMGQLPFLLPPLAEQKRIVAKLDAAFAHLETLKAGLARVPELLKKFRQTVLTQAITGKLTADWREENNVREEWKIENAKDCCEKVQSGGTPKIDGFYDEGIPFLKVYNIVDQKIDFHYRPQFVTEKAHCTLLRKSICLPGDVLMNIVGPPLNKIAIVPITFPEWNHNQAITLFRPKSYLSNVFLYYFFCEGSSVKSLYNETKGVVGQVNISLSQCRDFEIPIPPLEEQQEIVRRVEALFAQADALEAQYVSLKGKIDKLPQTLLAKAFRGELVPQDPNDELASVLLEKIKAAAAQGGKKKEKAGQTSLVFIEE